MLTVAALVQAATLVSFPFSADTSASQTAPGIIAVLDFSHLSGSNIGDDGYGNVLEAHPAASVYSVDFRNLAVLQSDGVPSLSEYGVLALQLLVVLAAPVALKRSGPLA